MAIPTATLIGHEYDQEGADASGRIKFRLRNDITIPGEGTVERGTTTATVGADGTWSVELACSSGPEIQESGVTYRVTKEITGSRRDTFDIDLPTSLDGQTVNLSAMTPVDYEGTTYEPGVPYSVLAGNPDLLTFGTIIRDDNGAATEADVVWPDGSTGTFTATTVSDDFPGAVDAYTITRTVGDTTTTYTQPAVTRDANGAVTERPAIEVA